jgi:hypothetical protein
MLLIFNLLQSGYYTTEPVASRYDAATMGMFVLIIVIGVIGYIVQARLQHVFKKYSEVPFPGGLTGAEVAEKMLRDNKIHNVKITHVSGQLTDHFNPQTMTVNLSDAVYSSRSGRLPRMRPRHPACTRLRSAGVAFAAGTHRAVLLAYGNVRHHHRPGDPGLHAE